MCLDAGKEGFKSIYGVVGDDDNMTYIKGGDRIPENYYRRSDDLFLPEGFLSFFDETVLKRPELFR